MAAKVIVGMSGGVDSAVAASLLLQQGFEVEALFMKNWEEDDDHGRCSASIDLADARQVCEQLGIALRTVNFSSEYWERVFEVFLSEYSQGRTPNPDILCNSEIKFKAFLEFAVEAGADYIATGHYARQVRAADGYRLLKGCDAGKDQSYFLYTLGQAQLARCLFPLGAMHKKAVRTLAHGAGFANYRKKDSTGICFIGERKFKQFLQHYLPAQPGTIETAEGRVVGEHEGLMYYTLGQRKGIGLGGVQGAADGPWYVLAKDLAQNRLIIGQGREHPRMMQRRLLAGCLSWVSGEAPAQALCCTAKTRYRQSDQACRLEPCGDGNYLAVFDDPQRAMTPGQSVVFYQDEVCLGGGIIQEVS